MLAAVGIGSWVLWVRQPPTPPPVISFGAVAPVVRTTLPPPLEEIEVLPPIVPDAQLVEAELEPEVVPEGESPLEMWPLPTDWVSDARAYRDLVRPTPPVVETPEVEPTPEDLPEDPPAPTVESTPQQEAEPPGNARVDPVPDPEACPQPAYPVAALRRGMQGVVTLLVEVDQEGAVTRVRVLESSGHGILDRAAQDGVAAWRFTPATEGGQPVPGAARVPIRFRIQPPR